MINPSDYIAYVRGEKLVRSRVPEAIIICYNNKLMKHIVKQHRVKQIEGLAGELYSFTATKHKVGIIGRFGIGAPAAAIVMEELIALGTKRFITMGTSGALQKHLDLGSVIVCDKAIRDEGTSHHYIKRAKYAYGDAQLTAKLENVLQQKNIPYEKGISWTIDTPYRETIAEAKKYQKQGVLTVEMEIAALFTIAAYRGVVITSLLTISDSLAELTWTPNFHSKQTVTTLELLYELALEVLV